MSADTGQILYARHGDVLVLKFVGLIGYTAQWTFPLSRSLSAFIERLCREEHFENLVVDLTEATAIDSTNLGLLAQLAQFMMREWGRKATILTSNPEITRVLHTVAFHTIFTIIDQGPPIYGGLETIPPVDQDEPDAIYMILNAHKALAEMSEGNRQLFTNIIEAIEADIQRSSESSQPTP